MAKLALNWKNGVSEVSMGAIKIEGEVVKCNLLGCGHNKDGICHNNTNRNIEYFETTGTTACDKADSVL